MRPSTGTGSPSARGQHHWRTFFHRHFYYPMRSNSNSRPWGAALWLLLSLSTVTAACGGSGSPTAPSSAGNAGLSVPGGLTISDISVRNRTAAFSWNPASGASGYVLEIGRTPSATDFAVISVDGGATNHRVTDLPAGMLFARLRAKDSSSTTAPGTELRFGIPDIRDIIEGLFLSTGPNAYQPSSNPSTAFWAPWAPGRPIVTRVAALTDTEYGYVERSLQQVEEVSQGSLKATIVERVGVPAADRDLDDTIARSPVWRAKEDLLRSMPGVRPVVSRTWLADVPELGHRWTLPANGCRRSVGRHLILQVA
jgi:hypothetical protein